MTGKLCLLFLLFSCVDCMKKYVMYDYDVSEEDLYENSAVIGSHTLMNSTLYKTIFRYYCLSDYHENEDLLIYGTKSWTFPQQDINLTLSYPSAFQSDKQTDYIEEYWITGFNVLLFVDSTESQGYINHGGIMQDSISLTFVCPNVNMLQYQFWLYGVAKSSEKIESSSLLQSDMC
ncbi:uncharacterized protein LOC113517702 [Galleria mellonella]|uniref:Uncharacterized protein LOC113517702 n=1 Tax=Galleria mellonella TaxID=7137 RepID=A0ABM3N390_GALME|nr:uncharacterized protein LOC113517702 [Galleria mellonella]